MRLIRRLFAALSRRLERSLEAEAPTRRALGLTVIDRYASGSESERVLDELCHAILMLRVEAPQAFSRLLHNVESIVVRPLKSRGYFLRDDRRIVISGALVSAGNSSDVALTLIHEITHARIAATGFVARTQEERTREEQICERRVRAFVSAMAERDTDWTAHRDARLRAPLPVAPDLVSAWRNEHDNLIEQLTHAGVPAWVTGFVRRWAEWRVERIARHTPEADRAVQS